MNKLFHSNDDEENTLNRNISGKICPQRPTEYGIK